MNIVVVLMVAGAVALMIAVGMVAVALALALGWTAGLAIGGVLMFALGLALMGQKNVPGM